MSAARPGQVRVGVIGGGAIGSSVIEALRAGAVDRARFVGLVDHHVLGQDGVHQFDLAEAMVRCDVLVECAGQSVVAQSAVEILSGGVDLLVTSVGALSDPELAVALASAGPGRFLLTSGAVGGVDILSAASAQAPFDTVRVTTTKLPGTLVQPWMSAEVADQLRRTTQPVEVFRGGAREAARTFPRSLNVAATVAWAVGSFDLVEVCLRADPAAVLTSHLIEATGPTGHYRFEIQNLPSPENPRTSGVVPFAVLRSLAVLIGRPTGVV